MKNIEKKIIILLLIIIIFLIVLCFITEKFGIIDGNIYIPTGKVDIIDITIIEKEDAENNSDLDNILVEDKNGQYTNGTPLNIFKNQSYHVVNGKIAPGSKNAYQFIIRNNNNFGIKYNLKIEEENPLGVNMKYRLKVNGDKLIGDEEKWVTANELFQKEITLANESYNVYTLEWQWFESENDTFVGSNIEANYKLNISFFANKF